ncbi:cryptochrome/photolyase family protein [Ktedonospora formicarum]|uniref:Cryptochrome/photolyase family protein n=1 Tax=Ktedonospora formicarum TaxID=2778364 RepID=A0A8J3MW08_9CHLR|nr:cryptochrome/photolyase family protein [Ktedonospora formicarum]GHO48208.1 cryptochrome/photolyase family protein [Ktedonospora formicarum]
MPKQPVSVWILGDQLLENHPALQAAEREHGREQVHIVMIESDERIHQLPYQRQKLVLLLSAMRHYADELRSSGYEVDYICTSSFADGLKQHLKQRHSTHLYTMAASEYDARTIQEKHLESAIGVPTTLLPNSQFLVEQFNPHPETGSKHYIMENFYRQMRKHFNVLMDGPDEPAGGKWNYDAMNREPLPKKLDFPEKPSYKPDKITNEVIKLVEGMRHGVGNIQNFDLAVTRENANDALERFVNERLREFGPYEDAMSSQESELFHSQLSLYVNIGLLDPMDMIRQAEKAYNDGSVPLNSAEGFIRQILGWREYMYWQYWQLMPDLKTTNTWGGKRAMPLMFWNGETEMNCVSHVSKRVLETGYSNHIERLMIVCNFCLLAGIRPYDVAEWFLACYFDAYDWVVLPNVIGMGLNADGGRIATKPYISSANYINKMSNYCSECHYSPKERTGEKACPYNLLYWDFLAQNEELLRSNPRLGPNVLGLRNISEQERKAIHQQAVAFLDHLKYYEGKAKDETLQQYAEVKTTSRARKR